MFRADRNVEVETFNGLLVDYATRRGADVIVRGLRAISDFEYEMQMALMNRRLSQSIETVFMMPDERYTYLSSRLAKEVFALGGSLEGLVPEVVEMRLREKADAPGPADVTRPGLRRVSASRPGGYRLATSTTLCR